MAKKVQPWKPTTIKRFIKAFPTSACTVLVQTDAGKGYLKAMGGPEGPHTLACECAGTHLARWLGLPTFEFAIIPVTESDEIPFHIGGKAQVGPAFITRAESGEPWSGRERQLNKLFNPQDISRLVVFDTWTLNCDRHSVPEEGKIGKLRINRNNVFLSEEAPKGRLMLKTMDHTHRFTCGRQLSRSLRNIDKIRDLKDIRPVSRIPAVPRPSSSKAGRNESSQNRKERCGPNDGGDSQGVGCEQRSTGGSKRLYYRSGWIRGRNDRRSAVAATRTQLR